jgi:hypothetical protein
MYTVVKMCQGGVGSEEEDGRSDVLHGKRIIIVRP